MGGNAQPVIRDLFPLVDALPVPARLRVAELLFTPASSPALLADEVLALPLPRGDDERAALCRLLQAGLDRDVLARLSGSRLGEVVPAIDGRADFVGAPPWPARLQGVLQRAGIAGWADLATLTLGDIGRWTNVGERTLAEVVGASVQAGMELLFDGAGPAPQAPGPACPDLTLLLGYERDLGDAGDLRRLLQAFTAPEKPDDVRQAAGRLLAGPATATNPTLAALDRVLVTTGDHRARGIFGHLSLRLDDGASSDDLRRALGISSSRLHHICAEVERGARTAAAQDPGGLAQLASRLRGLVGQAAPRARLEAVLGEWQLPPIPDLRTLLLVWLAGPYRPVPNPEWLAIEPTALVAATRRALDEDGGVRPVDDVRAELGHLGIEPAHVDAWLSVQEAAVVDGLVISLAGPIADVAERVLSATGRAMTIDELWAPIGHGRKGATIIGLERRARADARFVQVSPDRFELTEWGSEPYAAVAPAAVIAALPEGPSWLRVEIDPGVLGGSSAPVPLPLVEALGVAPGARRTFTTRYGPVAISHDGRQPTRGSVRPVALAAGAASGDALLLGFDARNGGAVVELVPAHADAL